MIISLGGYGGTVLWATQLHRPGEQEAALAGDTEVGGKFGEWVS